MPPWGASLAGDPFRGDLAFGDLLLRFFPDCEVQDCEPCPPDGLLVSSALGTEAADPSRDRRFCFSGRGDLREREPLLFDR